MNDTIAKLEKAKALLQAGWTKNQSVNFETSPPSYCIVGACDAVTIDYSILYPHLSMNQRWKSLSAFNDAQESVAPVLTLFDAAIEAERSK